MKKSVSAFTIVELLIVIVVIAILAAISIVAYNGIQTRAENTKTINSVAAYAKAVKLYAAEQGLYPNAVYRCLSSTVHCGNMTDTAAGCEGAGRATGDNTLKNLLSPYATSLPDPSSQQMNCSGKMYSGAWYHYKSAGKAAEARMYLKGNVAQCPGVGLINVNRFQADDTTTCWYDFPTLP
jgi:prepilin-type N-terminal cleavage/methylation domain-containing protein